MSRQSDIWEYLQGERTGKRANRFEREMLSDPFLYEAVEGLTTVKADHEKIVQQLQKRMKKREGNKCAFISLGGSGFFAVAGGTCGYLDEQECPSATRSCRGRNG